MAESPRTKKQLRDLHVARRSERSDADQERLARCFRDRLLTLPAVTSAQRVAAYLSQDGEPGTRPLIDGLHRAGVAVLIPVLLDDFELDWSTYEPGEQEPGRFGLLVPSTSRLGADAITSASVVICPGVAVDRAGNRLGRGGGSYDRALARCGPSVLKVQLVYDDEVVDGVPTQPHDQPVDVVVTPTTTWRVERPPGLSDTS